jgi:arylsulfatase A-like enzyme
VAELHEPKLGRARGFRRVLLLSMVCAAAAARIGMAAAELAPARRPNLLVILADDLGYSDIAPFGSEIHTPHLDALARSGRLLTSLYGTSMPISRAEVLTGADHHLVGMGSMESAQRRQIGRPAYQRHLSDDALCVSQVLMDAGYHTYMVGTWHLGSTPEQGPRAKGFAESFALLEAAGQYFAPLRDKPLPSGAEIWPTYRDGEVEVPAPDAYITDFFTDKLIGYIDAHRQDGAPFFAYASYTAPHFPLQAPADFIRRYRGRYDTGYDAIRLARLARQRRSGLIPRGLRAADPLPAASGLRTWEQLSAQERRIEARRMEIYAAMVENLDANVGRLIEYLRATNQLDDTLVVFTSGNGAAQGFGAYREVLDLDRMGSADSWIFYSERWAEVSDTPFRLWKGKPAEGGISVPGIVRLPHAGTLHTPVRAVATLKDIAPTLLDYAGIPGHGTDYHGRAVVPMSGKSLRSVIEGKAEQVHTAGEVIADEQSGEGYVRQGRWKALRMTDTSINLLERGDAIGNRYVRALKAGDDVTVSSIEREHPSVWSLYDVESDRAEQHDMAQSNLDTLSHLQTLYEDYRRSVGALDW